MNYSQAVRESKPKSPIDVISIDSKATKQLDKLFSEFTSKEWINILDIISISSKEIEGKYNLYESVLSLQSLYDLFFHFDPEKGGNYVISQIYHNRLYKRLFNSIFTKKYLFSWIEYLQELIVDLKENEADQLAIHGATLLFEFFNSIQVDPKEVVEVETTNTSFILSSDDKEFIIARLKEKAYKGDPSATKLLYQLEKQEEINHLRKELFNL